MFRTSIIATRVLIHGTIGNQQVLYIATRVFIHGTIGNQLVLYIVTRVFIRGTILAIKWESVELFRCDPLGSLPRPWGFGLLQVPV